MKKTQLIILLLLVSTLAFSQSYKEEIYTYREEYKQGFLEHERSPIKNKEDLQYLRFFEPDAAYRVTADFVKTENAAPFDIPTSDGTSKKYIEYGKATFSINKTKYTLTIYQGLIQLENPETKDYLFLPFNDETNSEETYGAGRYLDFRIGDIVNNKLEIDFNKCYNPYCAFAGGYRCPKPPQENNLPVKILAGEKIYAKNIH